MLLLTYPPSSCPQPPELTGRNPPWTLDPVSRDSMGWPGYLEAAGLDGRQTELGLNPRCTLTYYLGPSLL